MQINCFTPTEQHKKDLQGGDYLPLVPQPAKPGLDQSTDTEHRVHGTYRAVRSTYDQMFGVKIRLVETMNLSR